MLKRKNKGSGGIEDAYSKNTGQFNASASTSFYVSSSNGKEVSKEVNKKITENYKAARKKEVELYNSIGPNSTPERHYPKSFTITKKGENNE